VSTEATQALVRRYFEEVGRGNAAIVDELFTDDFVDHVASGPAGNRQTHRELVAAFLAAFPDLQATIEDRIAENWVIFDALGLMQQLRALPASD
jgi:hypothetical protein